MAEERVGCSAHIVYEASCDECRRGYPKYRIVDVWSGGTRKQRLLYTTKAEGAAGRDEAFVWVLKHTPFSNAEAPRQGIVVEPVDVYREFDE